MRHSGLPGSIAERGRESQVDFYVGCVQLDYMLRKLQSIVLQLSLTKGGLCDMETAPVNLPRLCGMEICSSVNHVDILNSDFPVPSPNSIGSLGFRVVDTCKRTIFLKGVKRCRFDRILGNPFQEDDHLRSC